jgi:hypothetical protein
MGSKRALSVLIDAFAEVQHRPVPVQYQSTHEATFMEVGSGRQLSYLQQG